MHRIYCPQNDFKYDIVITDRNEIHHLKTVLRLKKNDPVQLFNGIDKEATGIIVDLGANGTRVSITEVRHMAPSKPIIILACTPPKKGKFETIIEKTTELGVDEILPLASQHSEVKLKGERMHGKIKRFETVAINAAKQSKRTHLPRLHPMTDFREAVDQFSPSCKILLASLSSDSRPLVQILSGLSKDDRLLLLIGPEGDFTRQEQEYAQSKGALPISLGKNVLKVETAAIAAVGFIRLHFSS